MNNNLIELLIGMDISKNSKSNIDRYIDELQNKIEDLDIKLTIKGDSSNNKLFEGMSKQIANLQSQVEDLESQLSKVGSKKSNSNTISSMFDGADKNIERTMKSLEEIQDMVRRFDGKIDISYDGDKALGQIKSVTATIRDEVDKVSKLKFFPNEDGAFELFDTKEANKAFDDLSTQIDKAKKSLVDLNAQGKLNSETTKKYYDILDSGAIDSLEQLKSITAQFTELGNVNLKSDKWSSGITNIKDETERLISTFDKLQARSDVDFNTSQFQELRNQLVALKDTEIYNDADLAKANKQLSSLKSTMSTVKDEVSKSDTAMEKFNAVLKKIERSGLDVGEDLLNIKMYIDDINRQDITIDEKLYAVNKQTERLQDLFDQLKFSDRMTSEAEKLQNQIEKLNASLTKTENFYGKNVDYEDAQKARNNLNNLANNMPVFVNIKEVENYRKEIAKAEADVKRINAEATRNGRMSMSMWESFTTALQKFPIWINYHCPIKILLIR